jgi:hypothetical protein
VQSWIIGMHQPAAQDDLRGPNPDALAASSFPLKGGTGRRVDGGLVLNGGWSFASGIDFADWGNLQVFLPKEQGPPDHRFVLVPKQDRDRPLRHREQVDRVEGRVRPRAPRARHPAHHGQPVAGQRGAIPVL